MHLKVKKLQKQHVYSFKQIFVIKLIGMSNWLKILVSLQMIRYDHCLGSSILKQS